MDRTHFPESLKDLNRADVEAKEERWCYKGMKHIAGVKMELVMQ